MVEKKIFLVLIGLILILTGASASGAQFVVDVNGVQTLQYADHFTAVDENVCSMQPQEGHYEDQLVFDANIPTCYFNSNSVTPVTRYQCSLVNGDYNADTNTCNFDLAMKEGLTKYQCKVLDGNYELVPRYINKTIYVPAGDVLKCQIIQGGNWVMKDVASIYTDSNIIYNEFEGAVITQDGIFGRSYVEKRSVETLTALMNAYNAKVVLGTANDLDHPCGVLVKGLPSINYECSSAVKEKLDMNTFSWRGLLDAWKSTIVTWKNSAVTSITDLLTRMADVEAKNTAQDTAFTNYKTKVDAYLLAEQNCWKNNTTLATIRTCVIALTRP